MKQNFLEAIARKQIFSLKLLAILHFVIHKWEAANTLSVICQKMQNTIDRYQKVIDIQDSADLSSLSYNFTVRESRIRLDFLPTNFSVILLSTEPLMCLLLMYCQPQKSSLVSFLSCSQYPVSLEKLDNTFVFLHL